MATTVKAFVIEGRGKAGVADVQLPPLRADRIRCKTAAVALNPTDWKHIYNIPTAGSIVGCDFAGTVEEVGSAVTSKVQVGDRIAGLCHGANQDNLADGCFAERADVKDGLLVHVPSGLSMEAASTLPLALVTCAQALYQTLELPWPDAPAATPFPVLIYGGSTATGTVAIQLAKLSGLRVVTTASPHNHEMLRALGADAVFDYKHPRCARKIREFTGNQLRHCFDTVSVPASLKVCADALSSESEPRLRYTSTFWTADFPRPDVRALSTLAYTAIGEPFEKMGVSTPAQPDHYQFARKFLLLADQLVAAGKLKNHPADTRPGGLAAIAAGLEDLKADRVSGQKLVYKLA